MRLRLNDVRNAKYYCTKHECPLVPNSQSFMDPARTVAEVHARSPELPDDAVRLLVNILETYGHTRCSMSPASRIWPDYMIGEMYFTCPAAEAEFGIDALTEGKNVEPYEDLGRFL